MKYFLNRLKKIIPSYPTIAVILLNTAILFIAINVIASFINLPNNSKELEKLYYPAIKMVEEKPELMKEIHEDKSTNEILSLYQEAPNAKSHSVLEFMVKPCKGQFYNVGFENCRYNSMINHTNINQSIWVFGGSTVFGTGVTDDETITYFLNKLDTAHTYINFGVPAHCQKNEIEKLILLLQKGYRPKQVLFLDGLNDLYALSKSNFETFETPSRVFNAYAHDFNLGMTGFNSNLIYTLPIVKLYFEYVAYRSIKTNAVSPEMLGNVYRHDALYNNETYLHFKLAEMQANEAKDVKDIENKIYQHYQSNQLLVDALSKAYQFDYSFFYQPNGMFLNHNPFIKDSIGLKNNNQLYKNVKPVFEGLKTRIQQNQLPYFYDISEAHYLCKNPYVDLVHYSKSMNKKLAEIMLQKNNLQTKSKNSTHF